MNVARSTLYAEPSAADDDTAIVEAISRICDDFEHYGWRRVRAAPRHQGMVVNHKKIRRLMREHGLQPKSQRRYTTTTDSDHDQPIFPNLSKDLKLDGPDQLWAADITYVPIIGGFVYVAIILDGWSRRVVGYAMSRSIDARLTLAAFGAAVKARKPPSGCVHHSDRGSQYAAKAYRDEGVAREGIVACGDAERGVHGVRQPPGQNRSAGPVHGGHAIVDRPVNCFTLYRRSARLAVGISILGMKPNRGCHVWRTR